MRALAISVLIATLLLPPPLCGQEETAPGVPLHLAALTGNVDAVRQHIRAGTDLNELPAQESAPFEGAILEVVGKFIASIPTG